MRSGRGCDFARAHVMGVEYTCCDGKAVAFAWAPAAEQRERAEVAATVLVGGRSYSVEILWRGIFGKSAIRSAVIPEGVRFLPDKCFEFCERLCDVVFEGVSRVSSVGKCCFKRCCLNEFRVPDGCISIGDKCFDGCSRLCRVHFGEKSQLKKLGPFCFRGCNIVDLFLPGGLEVPVNESDDLRAGVFLGVNSVIVPGESLFEVPGSIRAICSWCFAGSSVRDVVFVEGSKIQDLRGAFAGSSVERVVFPSSSDFVVNGDSLYLRKSSPGKLLFYSGHGPDLVVGDFITEIEGDFLLHPESVQCVKFDGGCHDVVLGNRAFKGSGIREVHLEGVRKVGVKCFSRCKSLKSVIFPKWTGIVVLESKSFSLCGLERFCVPKSVSEIGYKCFFGCTHLMEVTFEEGSQLDTVGGKAFFKTSITRLVVPSSVEHVDGTSFYGVDDLVLSENSSLSMCDCFLVVKSGQVLVSVVRSPGLDVVVPCSIRAVGCRSFYRRGHIRCVSFAAGSKLERIEDEAFKYCDLDELHVPRHLSYLGRNVTVSAKRIYIEDGCRMFYDLHGLYLGRLIKGNSIMLMNCMDTRDVHDIPEYVHCISSECFRLRRTHGFTLSFSSSDLCEVQKFCDHAFSGSDLVHISFPLSLASVGEGCFENCQSLLSVSFLSGCGVLSFGERCFKCSSICQIIIPSSVEVLCRECFWCCEQLESVLFEKGSQLSSIGDSCFLGCSRLYYCCVLETMEFIVSDLDCGSFSGICTSASQLSPVRESSHISLSKQAGTYGISLSTTRISCIASFCFAGSAIRSIEVPSKVIRIGQGAFYECQSLMRVAFEANSCLQIIEDSAFYHTGIYEISFPDCLESLGEKSFSKTMLRYVCLPQSLQVIKNQAFAYCPYLKTIVFASGSVITSISGKHIFKATADISVMIPDNLNTFDATFVPYGSSVIVSENNRAFVTDNQFVYNFDRTHLIRCFQSQKCVIVPSSVQCLHRGCFGYCNLIESLRFEAGSQLFQIDDLAFKNLCCVDMFLPKSLKKLAVGSLYKCRIQNLRFEDQSGLERIDNNFGFSFKFSIGQLEIPQNLGHIDVLALQHVKYLYSIMKKVVSSSCLI